VDLFARFRHPLVSRRFGAHAQGLTALRCNLDGKVEEVEDKAGMVPPLSMLE
jgi:hypothetical protein